MIDFKGFRYIREYKQVLVRRLVEQYKPKVVLKTDAYNERVKIPLITELASCERVHLIDICEGTINKAKLYYPLPNVEYIAMDLRNIALPESSLDMILEVSTMNYIPIKDHIAIWRKFYWMLKKGGIFVGTPWLAKKEEEGGGIDITQLINYNAYWQNLTEHFMPISMECISQLNDREGWLYMFVAEKK
jgi:ubiquinone/menaquinone biosynthesis C-methylase UbiE